MDYSGQTRIIVERYELKRIAMGYSRRVDMVARYELQWSHMDYSEQMRTALDTYEWKCNSPA
jgi:hypothetical protein